ncbi:MAG: hemolysin family protein, partial [Anaerolineales bacterium]
LFCEWILHAIVEARSESWANLLSPLARLFAWSASPFQRVTIWLAGKVTPTQPQNSEDVEEEIMEWVDSAQEEGGLESEKGRLIHSIFDLSDTLAREIMVPRVDIVALESNMSIEEAITVFTRSGHSRLPLYAESIDQIIGLVYAKDLLRHCQADFKEVSLANLARPAYFIPEAKQLDELLTEMQQRRIHLAIVVDEYGGVAGLVTLEDIIEELLGEIQDEFDQAEELPYQIINDTEAVFLGKIDIDDFNEIMSSDIPKEEADTLGGFIYKQLGRVPISGEIITYGNLKLKVEQVIGRRIRKVHAYRLENGGETDEPNNHG